MTWLQDTSAQNFLPALVSMTAKRETGMIWTYLFSRQVLGREPLNSVQQTCE